MSNLLLQFGPDISIADCLVTLFRGFPYPTRMGVIRLSERCLFFRSPAALSDSLCAAIGAVGPIRYLVAPNALHHLFIGQCKAANPAARIEASPRLRRKRQDLPFDAELSDAPELERAADIEQVVLRGSSALTEIVCFPFPAARPSRPI